MRAQEGRREGQCELSMQNWSAIVLGPTTPYLRKNS